MTGDELARRRLLRRQFEAAKPPLVVPPMDGSVEQVLEDLGIVAGMSEEIVAEVRACPVVDHDLLTAVVEVSDAVGKAQAVASDLVDGT